MIGRRGFLLGAGCACGAPGLVRAEGLLSSARPPMRPAGDEAGARIAAAGLGGQVGYAALGPDGAVLAAGAADQALPPASTLKTVTTLYALDRLGAQHRFRTQVIRAGDALILTGGGDPRLDTDDLAELAGRLVASGATPPARFLIWGGALPQIPEIAPEQADHLSYNPALSGMMLNFNRVHIGWASGGTGLSAQARADHFSPRAYTVTAQAGQGGKLFSYSADARAEHWVIARAGMRRAGSRWLPVRKPELYAGDVFQTLCRAKGLVLPRPEVTTRRPQGAVLAALDSPPLRDILTDMLRYSTNLTAEAVGLAASGAGDLVASGAAMAEWLAAQGIAGAYHFADHSGLAPANRIAPMVMAQMLAGPGRAAGLADLLKHDPLAEDIGHDPALRAEVVAKTGTLNFVSNLAGYAAQPGRDGLTFAVFCADPARRAASEGQELPRGVITWTKRAKRLQRSLVEGWAGRV